MADDFQPVPNKSRFRSAEHEIYVMCSSRNLWKHMRRVDGYGNGGDHPMFDSRIRELRLKKPR